MENHRRRREAARRLRCLLALAGDYLKYLFMRRRRLVHKVARKALALVHHHGDRKIPSWPRHRAIMEYEFSCADSPSPAFLAAKRLLRSRLRSGGAAVSSCFGSFRVPSPARRTTTAAESSTAEEEDDEEVETTDDDEEDQVQMVAGDRWLRCGDELLDDVDDRAEEFINMFYQQLRAQSFAAVFRGSP